MTLLSENRLACRILLLTMILIIQIGCSQPVLESAECSASREAIKKFYSFHIGNDMSPSPKNLEKRKEFLSERLYQELSDDTGSETDYFTQSKDFPKAFRAGKCETTGPGEATYEVILFWRTDDKNIQKTILVKADADEKSSRIQKVESKN